MRNIHKLDAILDNLDARTDEIEALTGEESIKHIHGLYNIVSRNLDKAVELLLVLQGIDSRHLFQMQRSMQMVQMKDPKDYKRKAHVHRDGGRILQMKGEALTLVSQPQ